MKIWSMPDCGQKTGVILQKLKRVAGIQDTVPKPHNRKPSKPITDSHVVYMYMDG